MQDREVERELIEIFRKEDGVPSGNYRHISRSARYEILRRQDWICNICGKKLKYSEKHKFEGEVAHIDHIYPYSKRESFSGDINSLSNLQALCPDCNMKKHAKNGF